ncbi:MAG TPA: NtaA/DmoA family FMN-dependent monooxygenase [Solirubrobacterales bacterium]|nr:NtaA/DmoA family FMN-dependent monooxygenase [Solirubrobacterales bacterium]
MSKKQIKLAFSIWPTGRHASAWRLPEANAFGTMDPDFLAAAAQTAERAKFDYFFIGSHLRSLPEWQSHLHIGVFKAESFTLSAFLAAKTERIGLVATVNANFIDPYSTARAASTLDHLSKGRAAINIITSTYAGGNFGVEPDFSSDYDRTEELTRVIQALWDSWEDGAIVGDKELGIWVDESKAHAIDHEGDYFNVKGPLNLPKSPQGQVVILHAGASERSKEYAAKYVDVRFTPYVDTAWNQAYYTDLKSRFEKYGRRPENHLIIPGITFYVGETSREAHEKFRQVQDLNVDAYSPETVSDALDRDLSDVDPDVRLLDAVDIDSYERTLDLSAAGTHAKTDRPSTINLAFAAFGDENITLRDYFHFLRNRPYSQAPVVGSYTEIADWLEEQVDSEALDGAMLFPAYMPGALDKFADLVVPELQRRGRFRTEYEGTTLREHLGLPQPGSAVDSSPELAAEAAS